MSVVFKEVAHANSLSSLVMSYFVNDNGLWQQLLVCYSYGKDTEKLLAVLDVVGGLESGDTDKKNRRVNVWLSCLWIVFMTQFSELGAI